MVLVCIPTAVCDLYKAAVILQYAAGYRPGQTERLEIWTSFLGNIRQITSQLQVLSTV